MAFRSLIDCGDLVLGFGRDAGTGGVTLAMVPRSHRDALGRPLTLRSHRSRANRSCT